MRCQDRALWQEAVVKRLDRLTLTHAMLKANPLYRGNDVSEDHIGIHAGNVHIDEYDYSLALAQDATHSKAIDMPVTAPVDMSTCEWDEAIAGIQSGASISSDAPQLRSLKIWPFVGQQAACVYSECSCDA